MSLRITSGEFRNRRLETVPGKHFRPISERVKESLFSILSGSVRGSVFIDLFAGTGNVGLEALSRGAERVVFVENDPVSLGLIGRNIDLLGVSARVDVICRDVFSFETGFSPDIVFAGPPYRDNLSERILSHCLEKSIVKEKTLLIIQHHRKEKALHTGYINKDSRHYGITALDFFRLSLEKEGA